MHAAIAKRNSPGTSQGRKQQVPVPIAAAVVADVPIPAGHEVIHWSSPRPNNWHCGNAQDAPLSSER